MSCKIPPSPFDYNNTLAAKLGPCIDAIRGINAAMGLRPYRVFRVHTQWSGTVSGEGVETVLDITELLPVPKVQSMANLRSQLQSIGITEVGDITLTEVSTKYDEFFLRGWQPSGEAYPRNESVYWEIYFMRADGTDHLRRRFICVGVPTLEPGNVQWTVNLTRAYDDRDAVTGLPR
jgi:hypothetical protein